MINVKEKPVTSIICIVNNHRIFYNFLYRSLAKQKYDDYELIKIDNCNNQFKGATSAYEFGVSKAKGDFLLFIHQDIEFLNEDSLGQIILRINQIGNFGVVGVAGCIEGSEYISYSNIIHGKSKLRSGLYLDNYVEAQTVDECLFVVKKDVFLNFKFNNNLTGWHLYAVEYCLRLQKYNLKTFIIPSDLYHKSDGGSLDYNYWIHLKYILKLFSASNEYINTTLGQWKPSFFLSIKLDYYILKNLIKKLLIILRLIKL